MDNAHELSQRAVRKAILEDRRAQEPETVATKSALVVTRFLELARARWQPEDFQNRVVALYSPEVATGELDPRAIEKDALFALAHFAYPRVLDRAYGRMDFALPLHPTDWVQGAYGLIQPRAELLAVTSSEIDLVIVPGVAFDSAGGRIGRGAGFYDRALRQMPHAFRVALAFDFQIGDQLAQNPWDERMDWVVTETRHFDLHAR